MARSREGEKTTEAWAWDDRLTLEFSNAHPEVTKIEVEKADSVPTIHCRRLDLDRPAAGAVQIAGGKC